VNNAKISNLNQAVKEGLLIANPCNAVEAPKVESVSRETYTYYLALNTGMRQAVKLPWLESIWPGFFLF
jgi:hypothetical protein